MTEIDTLNRFCVATTGGGLTVVLVPPQPGQALDRDDALILAAWLVALADPGGARFSEILKAVLAT